MEYHRRTLEELGCCIGRTAAEGIQLVANGELIAEAKVGDFDVHIGVEEQIFGFQIAMDYIFRVQILHGGDDLTEFRACLLLFHATMCDQVVEDLACTKSWRRKNVFKKHFKLSHLRSRTP